MSLTFPRELRLLTPKEYHHVFQQPHYAGASQVAILGRVNALTHPRLGLVVSKKNSKRAHDRNRAKRLIRESFRLNQKRLPNMDFVVVVKRGFIELDNIVITELLNKLWNRHIRLQQNA